MRFSYHGVNRWGVGAGLGDIRMADTTCECTYCHWTVHLKMVKMVNFMSCVYYHSKKKKKRMAEF